MPIENDSQNIDGEPKGETPVHAPPQPTGGENELATPTTQTASQNEPIAIRLERELETGERWLIGIGIGIATLLINSVIALIYLGQLKEMRKATNAATQASQTAKNTLAQMQSDSITSSEQFKTQLEKWDASIVQANRLASATEMANRTIVEADRPWVSGLITVDDFEIGKIPKATLLWQNFGRRPAYTVEWGRKGKALKALPAVPFYDPPDPNDSDGTVVPGGRTVSAFDLTKGPLTVSDMGSLNSTKVVYFVYGFIKYKDVRTNHIYHSHVCYRYFPARPHFPAGWFLCPRYNDQN